MKFKRVPIRTTPSGNEISIPTYFFEGKNPSAPKAYLQSSIHGAEVQGNGVLFHLIEFLKKNPPEGDVTLVPLANSFGMDRKSDEFTSGRFDPTTGENWNRAYFMPVIEREELRQNPAQICLGSQVRYFSVKEIKSQLVKSIRERKKANLPFSSKLALTLQEMAVQADVVLDLHNANVSVPHLYSLESTLSDALYLGFPFVISIPPTFGGALDEAISAPWSMFQDHYGLDPMSIPQSYTLELGNQEVLSLRRASRECAQVIEFLRHRKVLKGLSRKPKPAVVAELKHYQTLYAEKGGLHEFTHALGKPVKAGKPLGYRLGFGSKGGEVNSLFAPASFLPILRYSSASLNEGDEWCKGFSVWRTYRK